MISARKDTEALLRSLPASWTVVYPKRRGGHPKIYNSRGQFVTTAGSTPRGGRGLANLKAAIKRGMRTE